MTCEKAKIAVLVSGGGTNLKALIDAEKSGKLKSGEITVVISNNADAYALQRAAEAEIETRVFQKKELGGQRPFEEAIEKAIEERGADLIILAGFMSILSKDFTDRFEGRIINVHPSLIPSFCGEGFYGLRVHEAALERGVKVSGATVHYVNEIPDGGKIIAQRAVYVEEGDSPETLQRRIMEQAEWILLPEAAEKICAEIISKR